MSRDPVRELHENGYCVLKRHLARAAVERCREAFWPVLLDYLESHRDAPNRGPHRHFLPMPFTPPCFAPEFFFDEEVLRIVRGVMGERIVAERIVTDQWGCDVPLLGSEYQGLHVDYARPLFAEAPDLVLPAYILLVSFGLVAVTRENGPIEIAPGTHRLPRTDCEIAMVPVTLDIGDVLIRHPWALHRGSPNLTDTPRALATIRYVRRWYTDASRDVNSIPRVVWESLTPDQQSLIRFPIEGARGLLSRR